MTWALETHVLFGTGMPRNVAGTRLLNFTKTGGNSKPGSNDFSTLMNLVMMVLDALTEIFEWIGIQSSALSFGKGPELFVFFPFWDSFLDFLFLLFAAFWSWKVPFQRYLQHFWVRTSHVPWNLQHFGARCEAAMSTVFAAFLSSNPSFSMEFATCCCSNCSWNMVVCN